MDIKQGHGHPLHEGLEHSFEDSLSIEAVGLSNFEKLSFSISRRLFGINQGIRHDTSDTKNHNPQC